MCSLYTEHPIEISTLSCDRARLFVYLAAITSDNPYFLVSIRFFFYRTSYINGMGHNISLCKRLGSSCVSITIVWFQVILFITLSLKQCRRHHSSACLPKRHLPPENMFTFWIYLSWPLTNMSLCQKFIWHLQRNLSPSQRPVTPGWKDSDKSFSNMWVFHASYSLHKVISLLSNVHFKPKAHFFSLWGGIQQHLMAHSWPEMFITCYKIVVHEAIVNMLKIFSKIDSVPFQWCISGLVWAIIRHSNLN